MASCLVHLVSVAFFILIIIQEISLATYPAKYEENSGLYELLSLFPVPAIAKCGFGSCAEKNAFRGFLLFGCSTYVFGLVIFIGVIFGGPKPIEDKLDKGTYFGPNILKMTLCLSPVLLLLLLSTGTDSMRYREEIWMVSLRIALDLFDGVEMLEIILEENELCHGVPKEFEKASAIGTTIQIICVNGIFLGLRLTLFVKYGKEASIFIAKNGIIIILGLFEICSTFGCRGCDDY